MTTDINHLRIRYFYEDEAEDYYFEHQAHKKNKGPNTGKELERLSRELSMLFRSSSKQKKHKTFENKNIYLHHTYSKNSSSHLYDKKRTGIPEIRKQNCIVKGNWSFDKRKHKNFLYNYMQQKDKDEIIDKPVLFNEKDDEVSQYELKYYENNIMDKKFYRFIISPEKNSIPLYSMVRTLMRKIEAASGYKLYWYGAKHTNTQHNHVHILINGIDKNGKQVIFGKKFISNTIRSFARDCCTNYLGLRTDEEIKAEKMRMPFLRRYTKLDKEIEKYEKDIYGNETYGSLVTVQNELMNSRLKTLVDLDLAKENIKNNEYYLEKDWKSKLRAMGLYNSYLDARNGLKFVKHQNLLQYKKEHGKITGTITKLFKANYEDSWTNAILVENKNENKAWYIPFKEEPSDKLLNATVEFGMTQTLLSSGKQTLKRNLHVLDWGIQNK